MMRWLGCCTVVVAVVVLVEEQVEEDGVGDCGGAMTLADSRLPGEDSAGERPSRREVPVFLLFRVAVVVALVVVVVVVGGGGCGGFSLSLARWVLSTARCCCRTTESPQASCALDLKMHSSCPAMTLRESRRRGRGRPQQSVVLASFCDRLRVVQPAAGWTEARKTVLITMN